MAWVQTTVSVAAGGAFVPLLLPNTNRISLRWQNIGANTATIVPDYVVNPAVGIGMIYAAGSEPEEFPIDCSQAGFKVGSASGTTIIVWEFVPSRGNLDANAGAGV